MTKHSATTIERWTQFLRENKRGSRLQVPFEKQQNLISYLFRPDPNTIKQVDLCCGRGFGKSVVAIFIATMALSLSGSEIGLFLEPDWKRVRRVFLRKWQQLVPAHLYELNKTDQCITWKPTGALLFYGPRNITGSHEQSEDSQLGQDTTFVISDEEAMRCLLNFYLNTLGTIREPSDVRFFLTTSTPRVGPYRDLVNSDGHVLFRGTSWDNPYLPEGYQETLMEQMGPDQARRELHGEFVTLRGKIWKEAEPRIAWPDGNLDTIHKGFIPGVPWYLFCDLGSATAAFVVMQTRTARPEFSGSVWVAVADLCPREDGSASRALQRLHKEFGPPAAVVAGQDVHKRNDLTGESVSYFATKMWGNVPIHAADEHFAARQIQHDVFSYMLCSAGRKQRRFTVAQNFVSLDEHSKRGVREMLDEDQCPEESKRRLNEFLPKTKDDRVQHTRDAILNGAAELMNPPSYRPGQVPA